MLRILNLAFWRGPVEAMGTYVSGAPCDELVCDRRGPGSAWRMGKIGSGERPVGKAGAGQEVKDRLLFAGWRAYRFRAAPRLCPFSVRYEPVTHYEISFMSC